MKISIATRAGTLEEFSSPETQARLVPLRERVEARAREQRTTFMFTIFQMHTEAQQTEQQKPVACQRGCSACCRQLVTCFPFEFDEIKNYVLKVLPRDERNRLLAQIRPLVGRWQKYRKRHASQIIRNKFKPLDDWYGKSCIFLKDDRSCGIYPVRPMDCRTTHNTARCEWVDRDLKPPPTRFFFPCDNDFNTIVIEQAARTMTDGKYGVTALPDWFLVHARAFGIDA